MRIQQRFYRVKFTPATINEAFGKIPTPEGENSEDIEYMRTSTSSRSLRHDSMPEALQHYRSEATSANIAKRCDGYEVDISFSGDDTSVECAAPTRAEVEDMLSIFADAEADARLPEEDPLPQPSPKVFIGHGQSPAWRDLKDHLTEQHGYTVEAYESGARAGHHIRDILQSMVMESSFAILVMTAEDEQPDKTFRARENVVHETGLFQGSLGFDRAVVLLEKGTNEFSNLHGIQQIRFDPGKIRETFGDVLATLRREFGQQ